MKGVPLSSISSVPIFWLYCDMLRHKFLTCFEDVCIKILAFLSIPKRRLTVFNIGESFLGPSLALSKRESRPRKHKKANKEILTICKKLLASTCLREEITLVNKKTGVPFSCLVLKIAEAIYYSAEKGQVVDAEVINTIAHDLESKTAEAPKPRQKWRTFEINYFKQKIEQIVKQYHAFA